MISIDQRSTTPVFEQIVRQMRYLIAIGHFEDRGRLPSTRSLASSLGISFHTVRKAYQHLEREGVVEASVGSGYRIRDRVPLNRSDRIERGAAVLSDSLQQLVGLGLSESEIEYLVDEQLGLLQTTTPAKHAVFVSASLEIAESTATDLSSYLQIEVEGVRLSDIERFATTDVVVAEFANLAIVRSVVSRAEVIGISTHLSPDVLDIVSRLLATETLGLLTRDTETIRYLSERVRRDSGFSGQIVATSVDDDEVDISTFFQDASVLLYTSGVRRKVRRWKRAGMPVVALGVLSDQDSLQRLERDLPFQR